MADKLLINSTLGISKQPESALSTIYTAAAEFDGAVTNALNIQIPFVEKILNSGLIGSGNEWAKQVVADYMANTGMTFADQLNTTQFAILAARFMGGTITSTEVESGDGVYDHVIEMAAPDTDPQLPSSSIAFKLGGFDFILGGMVKNNLSLVMQNGQAPTYSVDTVGTGYFEYMASQSPSLVLPEAAAQDYVGQRAQSFAEFNDGSVFDITGAGRLESMNLQASNNVITGERKYGDPVVDPTDDNSGAYTRSLTRGDQRTLQLSMGIYVADDKRGYLANLNNTTVTGLSVMSRGNEAIGLAGDKYHEVEVILPESAVVSPNIGGDRKGIVTLNFEPIKSSGSSEDGIWKIRIRNTQATLA